MSKLGRNLATVSLRIFSYKRQNHPICQVDIREELANETTWLMAPVSQAKVLWGRDKVHPLHRDALVNPLLHCSVSTMLRTNHKTLCPVIPNKRDVSAITTLAEKPLLPHWALCFSTPNSNYFLTGRTWVTWQRWLMKSQMIS